MKQQLPGTLFLTGCVLLITVISVGWFIFPSVVINQIENEVMLEPGTRVWKEWIKEKELYFRIYIFNVTNPEEIEAGGQPLIQEIGPYVYKKVMTRPLIKEKTENDTIIFKDIYTYHFLEELTNGNQDDEIVVLNIPYLAVAEQLSTYSFYIRYLVSLYLTKFKSKPFVRRKVREYLFEGTYEPMIAEIQEVVGQNTVPNSTFGIFYGKNGTDYGEMEVYSGKKDISRIGAVISWKGKSELEFWDGPFCNMMNGTDATVFSPFVSKEKPIYAFAYDICRSIYLNYDAEDEIKGILGYRFLLRKEVLDRFNPENRCFCLEKEFDDCPGSGVCSLQTCQHGAPVTMSAPMFYTGDAAYSEKFNMHPKAELHESKIILEPNTGAPLYVVKRIQMNANIKKSSSFQDFKPLQNMMFPLIWVEEEWTITEDLVAELQSTLLTPLQAIHVIRLLLLCASCLLILLGLIIFMVRGRRKAVFV